MKTKTSFQGIILKLQQFWADQGCLIWQPYYTQVGAGTMNPATFLRVLGPEPWRVAYVEPSVRPDDGRYGENPNRLHLHYQYQVILKPDPGNPQELYLASLQALGIDPRRHDIRFVEDNWEQPAIAAWGLGWEVWLDGQEITQFTYFQQVGGVPLDPVAVELTYGLERILIALNNANAIWDEPWDGDITYGEIRRHEEYEHSKYYFEVADVGRTRQLYEAYLAEAEVSLLAGLVLPAHDYVLKASHAFNTLDTRGAISLTERQACFRQMRDLARRVALLYLEQRKERNYPLLRGVSAPAAKESTIPSLPPLAGPAPFLLEIGVEELPASDVDAARAQLQERLPAWFEELRLEHGEVKVYASPRRIAVVVDALSPVQAEREEVVKGPPAERAFDAQGNPTPAALGFARSKGVEAKDLQVREMDGGRYVVALIRHGGRPAGEVLYEALPDLIASLRFEKTMRWNDSGIAFPRPIRWLVAMLGNQVIPFEYAGVLAGNCTRGLRPDGSPEFVLDSAADYLRVMSQAGVVLDKEERKETIVRQARAEAATLGGEVVLDDDVLNEVANLVENPVAVSGRFSPDFLTLPRQVLTAVMQKHQRYFPVEAAKSEKGDRPAALLPCFIAIRNGGDGNHDLVRQGNEHVLGARFADAAFFVREDLKQPLEAYRPKLATLVFQTRLGSMLEKADRLLELAVALAPSLGLPSTESPLVRRAAFLAKADLATQMVTEMTSLQGIIGREYALRSGEPLEVAEAIGEQYLLVPRTKVGLAIALADRFDSLVGLFAAGLMPTATKDPFALRRAAIGVVLPLVEHGITLDLRSAIAQAAALQPLEVSQEVREQVLEFLRGRLRVLLGERGFRYDVVEAVLVEQGHIPALCAESARQLQAWVERPDWNTILPAYARCVRILRSAGIDDRQLTVDGDRLSVEESLLREPAERDLYAALQRIHAPLRSVDEFLQTVENLTPTINAFFDGVLVMAEEEATRRNRLALVGRVAVLSIGIADLSKLEGF